MLLGGYMNGKTASIINKFSNLKGLVAKEVKLKWKNTPHPFRANFRDMMKKYIESCKREDR